MTGIFASKAVAGKPRCARCGRPFTPKSPGQDVGPKCARMASAQDAMWKHIEEIHPEIKEKPPVDDRLNLDDIAETRHTVIV